MVESLHPCESCNRHLRASTTECPFCGALRAPTPSIARAVSPVVRLSRAALFTLGTGGVAVGGAMVVVACENQQTLYGGPPAERDASTDASTDAPLMIDSAYGGPPADASSVDAGLDAQIDTGGGAPAYGAPPPDGG